MQNEGKLGKRFAEEADLANLMADEKKPAGRGLQSLSGKQKSRLDQNTLHTDRGF